MKIVVIGAGNWGTTLACLLAEKNAVSIWTNTKEQAESINSKRENINNLKGIKIQESVTAHLKFSEKINDEDIVLIAIPSSKVRSVTKELNNVLKKQIIVTASKGFEHTSFKTISEVISEEIPSSPVIVLSGPNIAREVAEGKPTKSVLASTDIASAARVAKVFKNTSLTFEICSDIKGVELCAALKGIIAIGVGISEGLELGKNFTGLIMTYGLREFKAISEFLGISEKTIYGIAGMGDLIATCLSTNSRNWRFGNLIGKGNDRDSALKEVGMVVEGIQMARTIVELENLNISIPLFNTISRIIFNHNGNNKEQLIDCLMNYKAN